MIPDTTVLLFAEDAGAANFIAPLPATLRAHGFQSTIIATGIATRILRDRGIPFEPLVVPEPDDQLLARLRSSIVIAGTSSNPDTRGLTLITTARRAGICALGVVDAAMKCETRFRGRTKNALAHVPDYILVPDEWVRGKFLTLGCPADKVLALGHPHYDFVSALRHKWASLGRASFRLKWFPEIPSGRKIVVFISEGSARVDAKTRQEIARYSLHGRGSAPGRTEIVLEEVLDALGTIGARPYLILRAHPEDSPEDYAGYRSEVDQISYDEPPLEIIQAADLVVGLTSMLMTEALLLGCPTLAVVPLPDESAWLPGVRSGKTPWAETPSRLRDALARQLNDPLCLPVTERDNNITPGSTDRICDFVESLLR